MNSMNKTEEKDPWEGSRQEEEDKWNWAVFPLLGRKQKLLTKHSQPIRRHHLLNGGGSGGQGGLWDPPALWDMSSLDPFSSSSLPPQASAFSSFRLSPPGQEPAWLSQPRNTPQQKRSGGVLGSAEFGRRCTAVTPLPRHRQALRGCRNPGLPKALHPSPHFPSSWFILRLPRRNPHPADTSRGPWASGVCTCLLLRILFPPASQDPLRMTCSMTLRPEWISCLLFQRGASSTVGG